VLDAVAQLRQNGVGNVERILRDKIDAHALGADQAYDLLDFFQKRGGRVVKQQVRFVEEENQLGLFHVSDFGQLFEKLGEHPQKKRRVELRTVVKPVGGEHVDHAAACCVGLHQVGDVEHRFAEEFVAALLFEREQAALDRADGRGGNIAVAGGELPGVVAHELNHGAQVFNVQEQKTVVVGDFEDQREHTRLGFIEIQQPGQEQRPHVGDGGAHRVPLFAEDIPEYGRVGARLKIPDADGFQPLEHLFGGDARRADAGEVSLDVGHEAGNADGRERLGHLLQRDGFARSRGAGDQSVAVGHIRQKGDFPALGHCDH
jgi:hypothetical protein